VLKSAVDLSNLTGGISNNRSRETALQINQFLSSDVAYNVVLGDFVPIHIGRKTVSPAPPAVIRVGRARIPNGAHVVAVSRLRFQMRVAGSECDDRNAGGACFWVIDRLLSRNRSTEKIRQRRSGETFRISCSKG